VRSFAAVIRLMSLYSWMASALNPRASVFRCFRHLATVYRNLTPPRKRAHFSFQPALPRYALQGIGGLSPL